MQRLLTSFRHAVQGIGHTLRTQANLRIHVGVSIAVVVAGFWLQVSLMEWAILVLTMMIVLAAELFNTAIEAAIDRAGAELHPLAKVAKDVAAGAVLIAAVGAVIVGILVFGPRLLAVIAIR